MFTGRGTFIVDSDLHFQQRQSQVNITLRKRFPDPPLLFNNPVADEMFSRLYWFYRTAQFRLFYKSEEADANSLTELIKFEPTERPPNLAELAEFTQDQFSRKWLKYIYAKFKNECPCGRMKLHEFKRLFADYLPNRISDEYFERVFNAFLHVSTYSDQLTFKDLIVCLAPLQKADSRANAEWTMRLINGKDADRVQFHELKDFIQSIYLLAGGDPLLCPTDSTCMLGSTYVDERSTIEVNSRVSSIFKEMDAQNRGYLTLEDLEKMFRLKQANAFDKLSITETTN